MAGDIDAGTLAEQGRPASIVPIDIIAIQNDSVPPIWRMQGAALHRSTPATFTV